MDATADQANLITAFQEGRVEGVSLVAPRIDTHISHVFLTEARAFKLKRAVTLPFLDFSTIEQRRRACEAELEVNKRFAADMYVAVRPVRSVTRGRYLIGEGEGEIVDWLVEMHRFEQDGQFDELAEAGRLTPALVRQTADAIANAHKACPPVLTAGHTADYRGIVRELAATEAHGAGVLGLETSHTGVFSALDRELTHIDPRIETRRREGKVRRTHGDLHLRNLCLFNGRPTPFDALEFDERLATTDVLYDLAYLLMDLKRVDCDAAANQLMNRYWDSAGEDESAHALMPFFMALRACVRMAVDVEAENLAEADVYRRLAVKLLAGNPPRLVAIGGLSGSGKSTIARHVAAKLPGAAGARLIRSDVVRKREQGIEPETHPAGAIRYDRAAREQVYWRLLDQSQEAFEAGVSVVMDATFQSEESRRAASSLSGQATQCFWLDASLAIRLQRLAGRTDDASDADASVARSQANPAQLERGWARIDATGTPEEITQTVLVALGLG